MSHSQANFITSLIVLDEALPCFFALVVLKDVIKDALCWRKRSLRGIGTCRLAV
ncbi:predicted protein [Plenodomus lingam JN3]|uniref:Uncharacterized protein n=1 Tax=Leptosphaeria maculans (strain JN3 / isolate v23.1.3 / race Av1-4-5-6-7-8) TaxID=985895 RepID=E5A7S2_LEPMJ|nr:predicted protein [Plenodomus lingam JN3]CBX99667.1 predicted protein [Plenodomus lingam JN3]